ncbi:DNA transposase THAP9 [Xyrichtys novacula]|uniref:DNA transposase THAP9 n=1 Tax=Xyrichtys novacula TaxID=13765 RepID=A0AAV1HC02_XYRNO|nr:DNA transposase THAP9 [Xyrichtys novacula]
MCAVNILNQRTCISQLKPMDVDELALNMERCLQNSSGMAGVHKLGSQFTNQGNLLQWPKIMIMAADHSLVSSQVCLPVHQQARKRLWAAGLDDCAGMAVPGDNTDDRGQVGTVQRTGDSSEDSGQSRQSAAVAKDHNYDCRPFPGKLDGASGRIQEVELNVISLKIEPEQMKAGVQQPLVHQFCFTDNNFRFYTKFISKEVFTQFWKSIEPSASNLVYWSEAQRTAQDLPTCSPCGELALIDEFFVFLCRVAAGFHERTLSKVFKVSQSTVSRIILTWTNYLYLVLGSLPLWMTREQVQSAMSDTFKLYYPEVRVIIDCAEIKCETPSSLSPQSETSSSCKNHTTLKGLIGISPCGAVTFVSKLFTGSISDVEITQRSQLLQLLEPGDGVVADKGSLIKKMLSEVGAKLTVPPLKKSAKLSVEGTLRTQAIARLRILSERAVRRVKEYHIWDGPVPLPMAGSVNKLWSICCIMSNFMGPLDVKGDKPI